MLKHSSQPYNPDVANAFFRAGMIETWGRGIERIMEGLNGSRMELIPHCPLSLNQSSLKG